jgi:hypothetical protein
MGVPTSHMVGFMTDLHKYTTTELYSGCWSLKGHPVATLLNRKRGQQCQQMQMPLIFFITVSTFIAFPSIVSIRRIRKNGNFRLYAKFCLEKFKGRDPLGDLKKF